MLVAEMRPAALESVNNPKWGDELHVYHLSMVLVRRVLGNDENGLFTISGHVPATTTFTTVYAQTGVEVLTRFFEAAAHLTGPMKQEV